MALSSSPSLPPSPTSPSLPPLARCTKPPIWQSVCVCVCGGGGGVAEHVKKAERKMGTNGSIRQNMVNKRRQIKGNEREPGMKENFFSEALQLMSGQKVTVYPPVAPVRSRASNSCHRVSIPPLYCIVITAEASVLFELSQEVPPPQQHLSVLSAASPLCITHLTERDDGEQPEYRVLPVTMWLCSWDLSL